MDEPEENPKERLAALLILMKYASDEAAELDAAELEQLLDSACSVIDKLLQQNSRPRPKPRIKLVTAGGVRFDGKSAGKP
jgi:hypothetical protein